MFNYVSLAIFLSISSYNTAFTVNHPKSRFPLSTTINLKNNVHKSTPNVLSMSSSEEESGGGESKTIMKSVNKEIMYDEKSGRFFESEEECDPEDEYCVVDKKTGDTIRLTLEEKERIFLDSLQSYYINGKQMLSDEEFDLLKSDLQWSGSAKVNVNRKEAKYIASMQAYLKGKPILSNEEFDTLKRELKEEGSQFAVSTEPKCYISTGICTVTWLEDSFRQNLLYLPVGVITTLLWLGLGYEILGSFVKINPLVLLLFGAYPIYIATENLTNTFIFQNAKVARGPCPTCEAPQRVYFGGILGVEGFDDVSLTKCTTCKVEMQVQRKTLRASTLPK